MIGDGFFKDGNDFYYKGVDIGYLRVIFASGVLGLVLFISLNFFVITKSKIPYSIFIFSIFLILSFKGFTNILYLVFLFYMFQILFSSRNFKSNSI